MYGQVRPSVPAEYRPDSARPSAVDAPSPAPPLAVPFLQGLAWAPQIGLRPGTASVPSELRELWPQTRPGSARSAASSAPALPPPVPPAAPAAAGWGAAGWGRPGSYAADMAAPPRAGPGPPALITPLALEAVLEGADMRAVCPAGPQESLALHPQWPLQLCYSEEAHRAHVYRTEERDIVRVVRAFMAMKERAQFLARENERGPTRQNSRPSSALRQFSKPSVIGCDADSGDEAQFRREETDRAAKRVQGWLVLCQEKEVDVRVALVTQEEKGFGRLVAFHEETIVPWVARLAAACVALATDEAAQRGHWAVQAEEGLARLAWQHSRALVVVGLLDAEAICRGETLHAEDAERAALTGRFYKGCGALRLLATTRLKECCLEEEVGRRRLLAVSDLNLHEAHRRMRLYLSGEDEWRALRAWEAVAAALAGTRLAEAVARAALADEQRAARWAVAAAQGRAAVLVEEGRGRCALEVAASIEYIPLEESLARAPLLGAEVLHRRAVLCDAEEDRRGLLDVAEWRQRTAEEEAFAALLAAAARRLAVVEAECGARSTLWLEEATHRVSALEEAQQRAAVARQQRLVWQWLGVEAEEAVCRIGVAGAWAEPVAHHWRWQQTLQVECSADAIHRTVMKDEGDVRQGIADLFLVELKLLRRLAAARRILAFLRVSAARRLQRAHSLAREERRTQREGAERRRYAKEHVLQGVAAAVVGMRLHWRAKLLGLQRVERQARAETASGWEGTMAACRAAEAAQRQEVVGRIELRRCQFESLRAALLAAEEDTRHVVVAAEAKVRAVQGEEEREGCAAAAEATAQRLTRTVALPLQRWWRARQAQRRLQRLLDTVRRAVEAQRRQQLELWACVKLQGVARMAQAKALRQRLATERRRQAEAAWRAQRCAQIAEEVAGEEASQRCIALEEAAAWGAEATGRAGRLAAQHGEALQRGAARQLEAREWAVLLQFAQAARRKVWDQREQQRATQQALRDLECEEREQRRALQAAYPAGLRGLRVEFECVFFGAMALDENRRRIAAMKAEEAGRVAIWQARDAEHRQVLQQVFDRQFQQLVEAEDDAWEHLLELWHSTWHQMRVAENLLHSRARVAAMESTSRPTGQVSFAAAGDYGHAPVGRPLKLGVHPFQSYPRPQATEAWAASGPRVLGVSTAPRLPSNALPELFAAAILKREVDARLEVIRKEEQMRESLLWSLHHGATRSPAADFFRVRGLTAPHGFPMTPPALQSWSRPSSQLSVTSLSSTLGPSDVRPPAHDQVHYAADGQRLAVLRPLTKLSSSLGSAPRGALPLSRPR